MNAIQMLIATAGQKAGETLFEAVWTWAGKPYACTHSEIIINPPLITGGFSGDTSVTVAVRRELFQPTPENPAVIPLPRKGHPCTLTPKGKPAINLQVQTIMSPPGAALFQMLCVASNQAA